MVNRLSDDAREEIERLKAKIKLLDNRHAHDVSEIERLRVELARALRNEFKDQIVSDGSEW